MTKKLISLFIILSLFVIGCGKKESTSTDKKEEQKTESKDGDLKDMITKETPFSVSFDITGQMNGQMTAIYKGKKAKVDYTMEMGNQKMVSNMYMDGEYVYMVSDIAGMKTGMKMNAAKWKEKFGKDSKEIDITSFRDQLSKYEKVGTEEVLGKKCDIYKMSEGHTISVYKETIPLKMVMGKTTMIATKYDIDIKVSDDIFTPPSDIKYVEMDDMKKNVEDLKNNKDINKKLQDVEEMMKKYKK
jgi:hypothetical protein